MVFLLFCGLMFLRPFRNFRDRSSAGTPRKQSKDVRNE